ncbi:MAG: hypothetical protein ACFB01_13270 [Cohaesibacteraceae bacterium]
MENSEFTPLGFSDLTDDESFIVSVFRQWRGIGPARSIAEHHLATWLRDDVLHEGLQPLFELFVTLPEREKGVPMSDSSVLSATEAALLEEIGAEGHTNKPGVGQFRDVLAAANVTIRSASEIPRSGHDSLTEAINTKAAAVFCALCPGT